MWAIWFFVAIVAGVLALGVAFWVFWPGHSPTASQSEPLPSTPLQREAWLSLGLGLLVTTILFALLSWAGPDAFTADVRVRGAVYLLLAIGAFPLLRMLRGAQAGRVAADERDQAIIERAPKVQGPAILVVLTVWTVALSEQYWSAGQIPVVFLTLILWSCFLVAIIALPLGILLGYRETR